MLAVSGSVSDRDQTTVLFCLLLLKGPLIFTSAVYLSHTHTQAGGGAARTKGGR